jgi:hypothetical protein
MIIQFGMFAGKSISDLPATYLMWLVNSDLHNLLWGDPWQTDKFVVPAEIELAAREELVKRNYKRRGMHWEKI